MSPTTHVPADRPVLLLPRHITSALVELHEERATFGAPTAGDTAGWIAAHTRQMFVAARISAWWAILARWIATESDLPRLLALAASRAATCELDAAERARADLALVARRPGEA